MKIINLNLIMKKVVYVKKKSGSI